MKVAFIRISEIRLLALLSRHQIHPQLKGHRRQKRQETEGRDRRTGVGQVFQGASLKHIKITFST